MPEESYGIFGVSNQRKEHPAIKDPAAEDKQEGIGFAKVDGQRLFTGAAGSRSMGATDRLKRTGGGSLNRASVGSFKVRRRTLTK